jgi:SAM-dependent methyltransferase
MADKEVNLCEFYNKLSSVYMEEDSVYKTASGVARKEFVQDLLKKYAQIPHLDAGSGGGIYINGMEGFSLGIDIGYDALKRAKNRNQNACFVNADLEDLSFITDSVFGSILCSEVIEHLENPLLMLNEFFRILRKNGVLILTCPNYSHKRPHSECTDVISEWDYPHCEYLHTAYKPDELAEMTENAGFTVIIKGSFEKELRLWRFIPRFFSYLFFFFSKHLRKKIERRTEYVIFRLLKLTGFAFVLRKIIKNGARSYIVAIKQ